MSDATQHMIWNPAAECMERGALRKLQGERLQRIVKHVYTNVPFYRERMQRAGVDFSDIRGVEDIARLPFTVKQDLRDHYPFGLFAVPMEQINRVHASSGTTGRPIVVGYTQRDIQTWAELMARTVTAAGGSRGSVIQVAYGYGLFTGGLGAHYGAERVGATVLPISGGNSKRQIMLMQDFGTTMLACTPSYALHLAETVEEMGVDLSELKLRHGIFGAEPWTNGMRRELEKKLGIRATDIYGLSEVMGPGVSTECYCQEGLHIAEDHFIAEIIDPVTLQPVAPGKQGELVFTTLTKEGMPVIRYRTRDLTSLIDQPCACGRTMVRMNKVLGRNDDMLIIRGVNVFPSQIESVLTEMGEVTPNYLIIVDRVDNLDNLEVQVELSDGIFSDSVKELEAAHRRIGAALQSTLGLSVRLKLVEPRSLARSEGKAKRVIDKRIQE